MSQRVEIATRPTFFLDANHMTRPTLGGGGLSWFF